MTIRTASAPNPEELVQLETSATAYGWTRQHYQDSITAGHQFFVAQHQNALVGFAVVMTVLDEAELLNIVIHQAHQGQGWGKRLLCHAIATLQHQNMHKLLLEVRESNQPARMLYQHNGFVETGLRKNYYPTADQGREHAVLMERVL